MMPKSAFRSGLALAVVMTLGLTGNLPAFPFVHGETQFVTVQPTSPLATEPGGNPGAFTVRRAGDTNGPLTIPFILGGTATNGVDYSTLPLTITLAAGQVSSNIAVTPIDEPSATGYKTVVLSLPRHETNFIVGSLDRAAVYIVYRYTNVPPAVSIVGPTNGASFLSLPNIEIAANASDSNFRRSVALSGFARITLVDRAGRSWFAREPVSICADQCPTRQLQPHRCGDG
jgi:hypothetical protein